MKTEQPHVREVTTAKEALEIFSNALDAAEAAQLELIETFFHWLQMHRSVADAARAAKMETRHLHDIIYRIREDKEIRLSTFGRIIESARGRKS